MLGLWVHRFLLWGYGYGENFAIITIFFHFLVGVPAPTHIYMALACKKDITVFSIKTTWRRLLIISFFYFSSAITRRFAIGIQWHDSANLFHKIIVGKQAHALPFFHGNVHASYLVYLE